MCDSRQPTEGADSAPDQLEQALETYLTPSDQAAAHEQHGGAAGSFAAEGCELCPVDDDWAPGLGPERVENPDGSSSYVPRAEGHFGRDYGLASDADLAFWGGLGDEWAVYVHSDRQEVTGRAVARSVRRLSLTDERAVGAEQQGLDPLTPAEVDAYWARARDLDALKLETDAGQLEHSAQLLRAPYFGARQSFSAAHDCEALAVELRREATKLRAGK